jgi:hypothetical protein
MRRILIKESLIVLLLLTSSYTQAQSIKFGPGADLDKLISISTMLATPENYTTVNTTISGTIVKVCKKRGCWVELASDKKYQILTIKVPDGEMVFPMSAMGKKAFATGTLAAIKLNRKQTEKHLSYRAKENHIEFDSSSVTEGMTLYRFTPIGVTIID